MSKKALVHHPLSARNTSQMQRLLAAHGQAGKGIYWDIIEIMYENNGYILLRDCFSHAKQLFTDIDVLLSILNDFGLFQTDNQSFWCPSVLAHLQKQKAKSQKAALSAAARWQGHIKQQTGPKTTLKQCHAKQIESNPIKQSAFPVQPIPQSMLLGSLVYQSMDEVEQLCLQSASWLNTVAKHYGIRTENEVKDYIKEYFKEMRGRDEIKRSLSEAKSHFFNWLRGYLERIARKAQTNYQYSNQPQSENKAALPKALQRKQNGL